MGGSVCRQVCKRQNESGDAVDVLADAPRCRALQELASVEMAVAKLSDSPASPASTADETSEETTATELVEPACLKMSEPTWASPEECERDTPVSESLDAVPKGLEPSSEPTEQPLSPNHELAMDQVGPVQEQTSQHEEQSLVVVPSATANSLTKQEAATEAWSDGLGCSPDEHPAVGQLAVQPRQQQQQQHQQHARLNLPSPASLSKEVAEAPKEGQRDMTGITVASEPPGAEEDSLVSTQQDAKPSSPVESVEFSSTATPPATLELSAKVGSVAETPTIKKTTFEDAQISVLAITGTIPAEMQPQATQDVHVESSHEPQQNGIPSIAAVVHAQAFAKALNEARLKKKISPSQLGQRIGRNAADVRDFESGAAVPSDAILAKMSRILNTELPQVDRRTSNTPQATASTEGAGTLETVPTPESPRKQASQARKSKVRGKRRN